MSTICIDPGHGGKFNHAEGHGLVEKDLALKYSFCLRKHLEVMGHDVVLTRASDRNLEDDLSMDLLARAATASVFMADVFVSVHFNAFHDGSAHGIEVWTSPGETKSDRLATSIIDQTRAIYPTLYYRVDRSDGDDDKESPFVVLMKTTMPAVLIEGGFLTNKEDAEWLSDTSTKDTLTAAWARGINNFLESSHA